MMDEKQELWCTCKKEDKDPVVKFWNSQGKKDDREEQPASG